MNWNDVLEYREGKLYHAVAGRGKRKGDAAGGHQSRGYIKVMVNGVVDLAHRIVWLMHGNNIPEGTCIDHINGDTTDNRIENLRCISASANSRNRKMQATNSTGANGVYLHPQSGRYRARIMLGGKLKSLGYFDTVEEAKAARLAAQQGTTYTERHGVAVN